RAQAANAPNTHSFVMATDLITGGSLCRGVTIFGVFFRDRELEGRMSWRRNAVLGSALFGLLTQALAAEKKPEKNNMELVGYNDLQARSAYQPVIEKQGDRWIAYVGHHGGEQLNPLTGKVEPNGTSVVDVTDPKHPKYLAHIPGEG